MTDRAALHRIFATIMRSRGVVQLAGFLYAGVSVQGSLHTYTENVTGMVSLLEEVAEHGVHKMVFPPARLRDARHWDGHRTEPHPS